MKTKQELLQMADELKYAELFEELDTMGLKGEIYETLRTEFLLNKTDIHWNSRLKTCINEFLKDNSFIKEKSIKDFLNLRQNNQDQFDNF